MDASQSRRARRELDRLKKKSTREVVEGLRYVMASEKGRRVLSWVIHEICRRDETTSMGPDGTIYRSAVRDVAVRITEALDIWCREARIQMEIEAIRRRHARRSDAEHARRVAESDDAAGAGED